MIFRKYAFADWATAKTAIQVEVTTPEGTELVWNQDLVACVVEIGHLCTQWGTDTEGFPVCEVTDPLYAVDIVWQDTEYAQAFCVANPDSEYCQPPAPFEI
jgi:hypothetical protein